jgi:uncharacterized protein YgiB involved in biofilm formation
MRFLISDTAYGSKRVWTETDEYGMIGPAFDEMNKVSIWQGTDKRGSNYASWEIDPKKVDAVKEILTRHGFNEAPFQPE